MRLPRWRRQAGLILLYHRVAALEADPQLLAVTPAHFAEQLDVVRRHAVAAPLGAIREASGARGVPHVAITFDDGYADNLHEALPLLEDAQLHATFFVVSGAVGSDCEFWWDDLERALLGDGERPTVLELAGALKGMRFDFDGSDVGDKCWHVLRPTTPSERHAAYRRLLPELRTLDPVVRDGVVDELRNWAGLSPSARPSHRPLDEDELGRLAKSDWASIGAHTVSHPSLAALSLVDQRREVENSKTQLEELVGPVTSFSYPFGSPADYTNETVRAVVDAGFELACANVEGTIAATADRFQLPRFLVRDWDGDEFERQLRSWLQR